MGQNFNVNMITDVCFGNHVEKSVRSLLLKNNEYSTVFKLFSIECCKTKIKSVALPDSYRYKQRTDEQIRYSNFSGKAFFTN